MKKPPYLFLAFLLCFPTLIFSQELPAEVEKEINRRVEAGINCGISIGILSPSGEMEFYNFGTIGPESDRVADSTTLYEIGSITKTFTASLAHQHLSEITLNKNMAEVLKGFTPINPELEKITPNELRNHTAGIPRLSDQFSPENWSDPYKDYSDEKLKIELKNLKVDSVKKWSYSNFGYGILGKTIEVKTGNEFDDLMGSFFKKTDMKNSFVAHQLKTNQIMAKPTNVGVLNSYWHFNGASRYAGAIISCTHDLLLYLKHQQEQNTLFTQSKIRNTIPTGMHQMGKDKLNYKNGWLIFTPDTLTEILMHNGGTGGFSSFLGYNKQTKTGVVILTNSMSNVDDLGLKIIYPKFSLAKPQRSIAYTIAEKIKAKDTDDLHAFYEEQVKLGGINNLTDVYWLERYYYGKKQFEISHQLSDIMLAYLPADWEVVYIKAQNLQGLKKYRKARKFYKKALELNPEDERIKKAIENCKRSKS